jgi:hypothetical protein
MLDQGAPPLGLVGQCHACCLFGADIAPDPDEAVATIEPHDLDADLYLKDAAILAAMPVLDPKLAAALEQSIQVGAYGGLVEVDLDGQQGSADQLLARIAQQTTGRVV